MSRGQRPYVVLLAGLPGTGKLTIARELLDLLAADAVPARLVDNHYVNNVIFGLLPVDGVTPLAPAVWDRVAEVREAVLRTVETLSPREWTFVFTLVIEPGDEPFVERLASIAAARGSVFVPVRLLCDLGELERRVAAPGRRALLKSVNVDNVGRMHRQSPVPDLDYANVLTLDVTEQPPREAARHILDHMRASSSGDDRA